MLDTLNKMEKREILESIEDWRKIRTIRNDFAHDYPNHESERAEALNAAWQQAPIIIEILNKIANYFSKNIELPTP